MKKIYLTGIKGKGEFALVDDTDFKYLNQWKWFLSYGYAVRSIGGRKNHATEFMHRIVNCTPDGLFTDHINRDKLDNRKNNLRTVSKSLNAVNAKLRKDNKSGYKGVSWDTQRDKWATTVRYMNKTIHLGRFTNLEDAAKAYNIKAKELFGEHVILNNV